MSKYAPLQTHLGNLGSHVMMTFDEIDDLVGGLATSARECEAWRNNHDKTHSPCHPWNDAGYEAYAHLTGLKVTFRRAHE